MSEDENSEVRKKLWFIGEEDEGGDGEDGTEEGDDDEKKEVEDGDDDDDDDDEEEDWAEDDDLFGGLWQDTYVERVLGLICYSLEDITMLVYRLTIKQRRVHFQMKSTREIWGQRSTNMIVFLSTHSFILGGQMEEPCVISYKLVFIACFVVLPINALRSGADRRSHINLCPLGKDEGPNVTSYLLIGPLIYQ